MFHSRIALVAGAALAAATLASAALLSAATGLAAASPSATAARSGPAKIELRNTSLGKILTNGRGFTLYAFSADKRRTDVCIKRKHCASIWPLVTTNGKPQAGPGVNRSMLGTIKVNGKRQVTYGGRPLYKYTGDFSRGDTSYVGINQFNGVWKAIMSSGQLVG
jgi:predicted lipoprotein with Yx(FWY)xxD motif